MPAIRMLGAPLPAHDGTFAGLIGQDLVSEPAPLGEGQAGRKVIDDLHRRDPVHERLD